VYRPWVASNCDDPAVFGGMASSVHGSGGAALPSEVAIPRAAHLVDGAGGEAIGRSGAEALRAEGGGGGGGSLLRHLGGFGLPGGVLGGGGPRASDGVGSHLSYGAVTAVVKLKDAADILCRAGALPSTFMPAPKVDNASNRSRSDSRCGAPKDLVTWANDRTMFGRVRSIISEARHGAGDDSIAWSPGVRTGRGASAHLTVANEAVVVFDVSLDELDQPALVQFDVSSIIVALSCRHSELPCASNGRGGALLEGNLILASRIRVDKIKIRRIGAKKGTHLIATRIFLHGDSRIAQSLSYYHARKPVQRLQVAPLALRCRHSRQNRIIRPRRCR
jgi:hypothetical protein